MILPAMQAACEFGWGGVQSHKRSGLACAAEALQVKDSAYLPLLAVMCYRALAALRVWAIQLRPSQRG
jgi:hypothetical protein